MKHKFTVWCPNYAHNSAGVRALYILGEYLVSLGFDVDAVNYQTIPHRAEPPKGCKMRFIESSQVTKSVMIVPEVLELKTNLPIMRWCLNAPGKLSGPLSYGSNEIVFYYNDEIAESAKAASIDGVAHELTIGVLDPLKDAGKPKLFDAFYEGKVESDSSHGLDAIRITRQWPPTKPELIWILDRCENFYSYDNYSSLNLEAHMCGCHVYIRESCEWREFTPDRPERHLYNPERDRAAVARAVAIIEAALT
jgi:hypothetical protein